MSYSVNKLGMCNCQHNDRVLEMNEWLHTEEPAMMFVLQVLKTIMLLQMHSCMCSSESLKRPSLTIMPFQNILSSDIAGGSVHQDI